MADPKEKAPWEQDEQAGEGQAPWGEAAAPTAPPPPSMLERADTAVTDFLAPRPSNISMTPYGATIGEGKEIGKTLGREVYSGLKSLAQVPGAVYQSFATPPTPQEERAFGPERWSYGIGRLIAEPVANAIQDYRSGRVTPDSAASVLPEAVGSAGAQVIGAKVAPEIMEQIPAGRVLRTAGKTLARTDITKPFQLMEKVPKYWEETSPESQFRAMTKQAISEGRASKIPTRLRPAQITQSGEATPARSASVAEPVGGRRLVLTPEEIQRANQMYQVAKQQAHERGMQYAGGMEPAGPTIPAPKFGNEPAPPVRPSGGGGGGIPAIVPRAPESPLGVISEPETEMIRRGASERTLTPQENQVLPEGRASTIIPREESMKMGERLMRRGEAKAAIEGGKQEIPLSGTPEGAKFETEILQQVQKENPKMSLSEQTMKAADRVDQLRGRGKYAPRQVEVSPEDRAEMESRIRETWPDWSDKEVAAETQRVINKHAWEQERGASAGR